jgi:superoxide dismutase
MSYKSLLTDSSKSAFPIDLSRDDTIKFNLDNKTIDNIKNSLKIENKPLLPKQKLQALPNGKLKNGEIEVFDKQTVKLNHEKPHHKKYEDVFGREMKIGQFNFKHLRPSHEFNYINKLRGIPDHKMKPNDNALPRILGLKGNITKDLLMAKIGKENGRLNNLGAMQESLNSGLSYDDARAQFMRMYQLSLGNKPKRDVIRELKTGKITIGKPVEIIKSEKSTRDKIRVEPVVSVKDPDDDIVHGYTSYDNVIKNAVPTVPLPPNTDYLKPKIKAIKAPESKLPMEILPEYIEDTNIEKEHKKRQRKLNKELPNYIKEKEIIKNKPKKGKVEIMVSNIEKQIQSQTPQIEKEEKTEEKEEDDTKTDKYFNLTSYHKGRISTILKKKRV